MTEYVVDRENVWPYGSQREEIVRCRDCKFCMRYWGYDYCDFFSHVTNDPDGFCAWAERSDA